MRRNVVTAFLCVFSFFILFSCKREEKPVVKADTIVIGKEGEFEEDEEYESPEERYRFEFERIKDPALGYVPAEKLLRAIDYTANQKAILRTRRTKSSLTWNERGPIYDMVGPSNGNTRGGSGNNYTAGRTRAILIDTLNDPTGNTVFCGSVSGGLWKCTNFISGGSNPNWTPVDDRFENLAIAYIYQDPSAPNTMYFATGEPYSNIDAVIGLGVWKSTNGGATWTRLPSTAGFRKIFKLVCDASGNLYLGNRFTSDASSNANGVYRSTDGGTSWQNITPSALTSGNAICTDLEFTLNGRLHASFGYSTGSSTVQHQYANNPATVTSASGWAASTGIRIDNSVAANRLELASVADTMYAVTTNSSNNVDSAYKSIDGGATWTKQNTTAYTAGVTNGQGWYNLTLSINPAKTSEIMVGGLDAYKSTNSGATITRQTYWVTSAPYVHADHHFMQWGVAGSASRIVIGCDGGVFLSNDNGATFTDKNRNLAIKQFYAGAIHPDAGSNYMIGGTQDNGVHQLKQPGKSPSTEVTGGDGAYVHINQQNPQIQFGSYVFNQYQRSTDGGNTWSSISFSNSAGRFINPWDYDDGQNILYACWSSNTILRWKNAHNSTAAELVSVSNITGGPSALKVSPFTKDRVYIATGSGKLVRLDNASTVSSSTSAASTTDLTGSLPLGYINCVNTGSSDNVLVATYSSYGVQQVWYTINGGSTWTNIDGNLPDMPVRWAAFDPQSNNKMFIATEAGVYYTDAINGSSTVWTSDPNFPTVRTDMLKIRLSDNTIMAATHGRGIYTATIPATPEIRFTAPFVTVTEATTGTADCRGYTDYNINVSAVAPPTGDATVTYSVQGGNTAVQGVDFDFTTNGNFASSSNQHVFQSGVGGTKALVIRVYDDDAIEQAKSFTVTLAVSGSTDAFAGAYNSFTVAITDNDVSPSANSPLATVGTTTYTLGNSSGAQPFDARLQFKKTQILFLASELTASGLTAGPVKSVAFNIASKNSTRPYQNLQIKMGSTTTSYLYNGSAFNNVSTSIVKNVPSFSTVAGWNTFLLDNVFIWNGTSNIVIEVCYDNGSADAGNFADVVYGYSDGSSNGNMIWADNLACGSAYNTFTFYNSGVKAQLRIQTGNPTETVLNSSKSSYLGENFDVPYLSTSKNVLARITSLSNFNYGCTEVKIDRAGTGAVPFWNNNPANYVMQKTYMVTPASNNTSGQYQITLYFTAAEKEGWEAATGNSWNNIQLIKTQGSISNVTPSNPNGAGGVQIVAPTHGRFGDDYTLSYTFNSGFSGFVAGIPGFPLSVVLLDFQGRLENRTAELTWSTSSEQNSRNFEIEKSTDGTNFYKIGSVEAAGNSSVKRIYTFRDGQLSPLNYYRLRMNDKNGAFKQSNVVLINYSAAVQKVIVVNNPFRNNLDIRFAKQGNSAKLQLISASGVVLAEKQVANPSGQISWQLPGSLSAGSYILRSVVDGVIFTNQLIKQ